MVKHGKPGIMLDRIFSEHKLRGGDSSRFPGGDGYYVRTTDGKRIGAHSRRCPPLLRVTTAPACSPLRSRLRRSDDRARVQHRTHDQRRAARGQRVAG
jgi:hypothetical protein